jgi:hypothetical protein
MPNICSAAATDYLSCRGDGIQSGHAILRNHMQRDVRRCCVKLILQSARLLTSVLLEFVQVQLHL